MPYLKTRKGRKTYYRDKGEGIPLIFLHGMGGDSFGFCQQEDYFTKKGYRVISFDAAGHGLSDSLEDKLDPLETYFSDLVRLLEQLKIDKCAIIGHSMGGAIALYAGSRIPKKISAIAALDSSYKYYDSIIKFVYWKIYTLLLKATLKSKLFNSVYRTFFRMFDIEKEMPEKIKRRTQSKSYYENYKTILNEIKSLEKYRGGVFLKDLKKITAPVFLLCGERDLITPPKISKEMDKEIPNSKLHIMHGNLFSAGHGVYQAQQEKVNKLLLNFLKKHSQKK